MRRFWYEAMSYGDHIRMLFAQGKFKSQSAEGLVWLIETNAELPGEAVLYFCADGEWCNWPGHAHRFPTKAAAENKAKTMRTFVRVTEHIFGELQRAKEQA